MKRNNWKPVQKSSAINWSLVDRITLQSYPYGYEKDTILPLSQHEANVLAAADTPLHRLQWFTARTLEEKENELIYQELFNDTIDLFE